MYILNARGDKSSAKSVYKIAALAGFRAAAGARQGVHTRVFSAKEKDDAKGAAGKNHPDDRPRHPLPKPPRKDEV